MSIATHASWRHSSGYSPLGTDWLTSVTTEMAVVEKPAEADEHAGHGHHGHAH